MTNFKLTLLAAGAIGAASIGGASALPFNGSSPALGESDVQQVRIVCNQYGQCYDTRNRRTTRYYAPDQRGYAYGHYDRRYREPGVAVGVGPFDVWVR